MSAEMEALPLLLPQRQWCRQTWQRLFTLNIYHNANRWCPFTTTEANFTGFIETLIPLYRLWPFILSNAFEKIYRCMTLLIWATE